ncbi:MAG: hypothetical protein ACXW2U_16740 [Telluria sp.]
MSYDLIVFAPEAAPSKRAEFLDWYEQQTEFSDDEAYDDPAIATPPLQAFFAELASEFPPAQGEEETGTDYIIGPSLIYMTFFDWDKIDDAHGAVSRLAAKHMLGFFDISSDLGEVWLPDRNGGLRIAHSD